MKSAENTTPPLLRTYSGAQQMIKESDPNTPLTVYGIKQIVKENDIRIIKRGRKTFVNMHDLYSKLGGF